jgi:hypothetical protein
MGDADMTAYDAEHTLAMLDAGTFDLPLTAEARQRLCAPSSRAARHRPRRRCGRGASSAAGIAL